MPKVRWLLVEDHGTYKNFPSSIDAEADQLEHVGSIAMSAEDGLARAKTDKPDVILVDPQLPRRLGDTPALKDREHGTWCAVEIRTQRPATQVLMISHDLPDPSSVADRDRVKRLYEAGVLGYLSKELTYVVISAAILAASRGEPTFRPGAAFLKWRACLDPIPHPCFDRENPLTTREHEAMLILARTGWTNAEIGDHLKPPVGEAQAHKLIRESCEKLGLGGATRGQLIVWARENCPDARSR